jgi:cytoskeletal protein RodZ
MGPVSGNRTPMIITLSVLAVFVVMVAVLIVASFVAS